MRLTDFSMDTITLAGPLEAKLRAIPGAGFTPVESYIWETECETAKTPSIPSMGILMVGPVLMGRGTAAQREHYLPRILSEKDPLCSPALKHRKLAEGVYWYEKKRI